MNNSELTSKNHFAAVPPETKILLVEDSGLQAKTIVKLLQGMGYQSVAFCANSEEAVDRIRSSKPALILCDWEMPKKNGLEVLQELKKDPVIASIPFIFLTAHAAKEIVIEAIKNGAQDYIVKPLTAHTIAEKFSLLKLGS